MSGEASFTVKDGKAFNLRPGSSFKIKGVNMTTEKTRNMCLDEAYELDAVKKGLEPNPVFPAGQAYLRANGALRVSSWGEPPPKKNTNPPIKDLVSKDIESRADMGFGKYGTYLQAGNGRNALKDAYEEALDLCMYLRQKLCEEQGH